MGLSAEQLAFRRTGIGASESPCLVGVSPFGNAHSVFAEKMGLEIRATTLEMDLGNYLEEGIARLYARETGYQTAHFGSIRHPEHPFMLCTPDICIFGERRIAQIKLVGMHMAHHWTDDIPDYVTVQIQHELEVCDADVCDVVALIGGTDLRILPVERDREMGRNLIEVCRDFYERHIRTGVMPDLDGSEEATAIIRARYARQKKPTLLTANGEAERWGRLWVDATEREKKAATERELAAQHLKVLVGDNAGIEGESFRATWKQNKAGVRSFRVTDLSKNKERAA